MTNGARKLAVVVLSVAMVVSLFEGYGAMTMCNLTEDDLETCRPAVTASPNPPEPTGACCDVLKNKANLTCLCEYKNSFELPLLGIDPNLAMALPQKCKLDPPAGCQ